ncbi:hypothetical protein BCV71DRAFT_280875 [Rhizopus microsporus]|uniref:Uncharacterized protein n=1 Tax=Rhizopus microsporus TaxID=58291 RepID=A0A1X0RKT4_RHIZD|nr:hypothetical protein BCV71DRAFT_280875 [Rhizopus microsporus]
MKYIYELAFKTDNDQNLASKHPMQQLTKNHVTDCLNIHQCLFMAETIHGQF